MREVLGYFGLVIICVVLMMLLGTGLGWWGLWFNRVSMPYQEQTRRLTYQQSATHQEGSNNNFMDLCVQYVQAKDDTSRDMIRAAIRQRRNVYAGPDLSQDVESCFARLGL